MIIRIKNWAEYQVRADRDSFMWFRLNKELPRNKKIRKLTPQEAWLFVSILCFCAEDHRYRGQIDFDLDDEILSIYAKCEKSALKKLCSALEREQLIEIINFIAVDTTATPPRHHLTPNGAHRTEQNSTIHNITKFDFDALYNKYPRKIGKTLGFKKLSSLIKSETQYTSILVAIENYSQYIKSEKIEPKFIKHFPTFLTSWEDWLDYKPTKPDEGIGVF